MDLIHDIMRQPLMVQIWIGWLGVVNMAAVFTTDLISLAVDYTDVIRFALGERL